MRISAISGPSALGPRGSSRARDPLEGGFMPLPDDDDAPVRPARRRPAAAHRQDLTRGTRDESWPWRSPAPAPDGFMAPVPPANGPLAANGTGWLIGEGGSARRTFPRVVAMAYRAFPLCCLGPSVAQMLDLPGLAGALVVGFLPVALFLGATKLAANARLRHQMTRTPRNPALLDPQPGSLVRVRGVITDQATIPSLFRGKPAVISRNRVGLGEETRGIDFWMQDPTGQRVRIQVRDAFLLDRPTRLQDLPVCDPVSCSWSNLAGPRLRAHLPSTHLRLSPRLFEASVGPGDEIEVCGLVERAAGPEGEAGPGRGTPLYWTLRGTAETPLLVRRVMGG